MTDRNLYIRASEGDPDAEREVLARLRRRYPPTAKDLALQVVDALMPKAIAFCLEGDFALAKHMTVVVHDAIGEIIDDPDLLSWLYQCEKFCGIARSVDLERILWDAWQPAAPPLTLNINARSLGELNINARSLGEAARAFASFGRAANRAALAARPMDERLIGEAMEAADAIERIAAAALSDEEWEQEQQVIYGAAMVPWVDMERVSGQAERTFRRHPPGIPFGDPPPPVPPEDIIPICDECDGTQTIGRDQRPCPECCR